MSSSLKKVLLVEDDPFLYKILEQRLKDEGVEVVVAVDGEMAIVKAVKDKPDLIVLDLILPKKNGFTVMSELRKKTITAQTPVLILTNLGEKKDIQQIEEYGVEEYLVKVDYSLAEIINKIKKKLA